MPGFGLGSADLDSAWLILAPSCRFASVALLSCHPPWISCRLYRTCSRGRGGNARGKVQLHMHVSSSCWHVSANNTLVKAIYMPRPLSMGQERYSTQSGGGEELQNHMLKVEARRRVNHGSHNAIHHARVAEHLEKKAI